MRQVNTPDEQAVAAIIPGRAERVALRMGYGARPDRATIRAMVAAGTAELKGNGRRWRLTQLGRMVQRAMEDQGA